MKKYILTAIFLPVIAFSQVPAGYYNGTAGLSGYALKTKLHEILSTKVYSYNYSDIVDYYVNTDKDSYYENNNSVLDIYTENPTGAELEYNFTQNIGSANAEGLGFNKEHGMPQSTYYGIYPMYSDIHYLIPTDARINQLRSNYPYGRTTGLENNGTSHNCNSPNTTPCIVSNGSKLGKSITPGYTNTVYEPIDEFKGDVARFLLYFITRYEGSLNSFNFMLSTNPLDGNEESGYESWYINMLKDWNTLDPVSVRETDRNNAVFAVEKTRNPFIDHPEWVNLIWSETTDAIAPAAPSSVVVSQTAESYAILNWQPNSETDILGYKIYVNGNIVGYSKTNSFTVDRLTASTAYNFTVKAYDKGFLLSPDSNTATTTTLAADSFAKDLMITKYIEGSSNNKALEITNKTNHPVDLKNYFIRTEFYGNSNYYMSDAHMLEGIIAPGESKVIIRPDAALSSFPVSNGDFITNSPPMTFSGSNYVEIAYGVKYLKTASTNNYDMSFVTVDAVGTKGQSNSSIMSNASLYRNTNVTDPNTTFTLSEWTSFASNYHVGLGTDSMLGTHEIFADKSLKIYPNPVVEGLLFIQGDKISEIRAALIFDMNGRLITHFENPFRKAKSINVSNLATGAYILNLDGQNFKFLKK